MFEALISASIYSVFPSWTWSQGEIISSSKNDHSYISNNIIRRWLVEFQWKGRRPHKLVHHFILRVQCRLPFTFKIPQEPIFSMIHRYLAQSQGFFFLLKAPNVLFCPLHISESQQEAQIAGHHILVITCKTFHRNCETFCCNSRNIFFPPLPLTSKVV